MTRTKTRDLTAGSIPGGLLAVAAPILVSHLLQNLYGSVDSILVGRFAGKEALAAVSSTEQISRILINFFTGLSTGGSVLFSRRFGARDEKGLHDAVHTALAFALALGLGLAVVGILLAPGLLRLIRCPADVFADALLYIRIYLVGAMFTALYNTASAILRSVGDSGTPLRYLTAASVANLLLDLLLVGWLGMGVGGAAAATVAAQLLATVLVWRNLSGTGEIYRLQLRDLRIRWETLRELLRLGLPNAVQLCVVSMSKLMIQRWINRFGSAAMAGIGAANKVDNFLNSVGQSLGMALLIFIAQNTGAGNEPRAEKGPGYALGLGAVCMTLLNLPLYFGAPWLIRLFLSDPESVSYGVDMVRLLVPLYYILLLHNIFIFTLRGRGKSKTAMAIGLLSLVGCRQLYLNVAMGLDFRIWHIYFCYAAGWIGGVLISGCYFLSARLRKNGRPERN